MNNVISRLISFLALTSFFFVFAGPASAGTPTVSFQISRYYNSHTFSFSYQITNETERIGQISALVRYRDKNGNEVEDTNLCGEQPEPEYSGETNFSGSCIVIVPDKVQVPSGNFWIRLEVSDQAIPPNPPYLTPYCGIFESNPCTTVDVDDPVSPGAPSASLNSDNTINVNFGTASDPAPSSGVKYKLIRTPDWNAADSNEAKVKALEFTDSTPNTFYFTNGAVKTFKDFWVSAGTAYSYKLQVTDNAGNSAPLSNPSNSVTTPAPPPPTPGSPSNGSRIPSTGTPGTTETPTTEQPTTEEPIVEEPKQDEDVAGAEEQGKNFVGIAVGIAAVLAALGAALIIALRRRMKEFQAIGFDEEAIEEKEEEKSKK